MSRAGRIAAVTLGLAAAAAVVGGVVGTVLMAGWVFVLGAHGAAFTLETLLVGATFGAAVGALLGPAAAWLLMRHVPLGKAIGSTALGTLAGAVAGLFAGGPLVSFYGAFLGFAASAVVVRVRTPKDTRRLAAPSGPGALP